MMMMMMMMMPLSQHGSVDAIINEGLLVECLGGIASPLAVQRGRDSKVRSQKV